MFGRTEMKLPAELQTVTTEQLLKAPEIRAIAARLGDEALARRKELVKQLRNLEKMPAGIDAANARVAAAEKAIVDARAALKAAQDEHLNATGAVTALDVRIERSRIEAQLVESADPRIAQFYDHIDTLLERTRHMIVVLPAHVPNGMGGKNQRYNSNAEEITATRELLGQAGQAALDMRIEALSTAEVRSRLSAWCEKLAKPLGSLNLTAPVVTDSEVKAA